MRVRGGRRLAQLPSVVLLLVGYLLQASTASGSPVSVQPAAVLAAAGTAQQRLLNSSTPGTTSTTSSSSQQPRCEGGAAGLLPGDPDPDGEALLAWVQKWGGEANVVVRRNVPGSGRGTFAPRAFKKGDVLASIPVEMTYALDSNDESLAVSATYMLADMAEEDSPWEPYFKSLPSPEDVWSTCHIPKAYFPIIQDRFVEEAIVLMQDNVEALWESFAEKYRKVLGPEVSARNITHAMGLLLTRLFRFDKTDVLLPIVDMANHENTCLHSHVPEPCDPKAGYQQWKSGKNPPPLSSAAGSGLYGQPTSSSSSSEEGQPALSGQCIVWRAEEDVAAGQEVCNSYKTLRQDRALIQYGFLQAGAAVKELNMFDRHDQIQDLDHVWTDPPGAQMLYGPRRFEGTPAQIRAEIERLTARLETLNGGEAAVAAIKPDPDSDPTGYRLTIMLEWRRQRKAAMSAEISRLERQLARIEAAIGVWRGTGKGSSQEGEGLQAVSQELLQWLEANGAQVHVELRSLEPQATQQTCSSSSDSSSQGTCSAAPADAAPAAGVFTRTPVKSGENLAVIPVSLGYPVKGGDEKLDSALVLVTDIQAALDTNSSSSSSTTGSSSISGGTTSRLAGPFGRSLPPFGSVRSLYNFPSEYMPVIQQGRVERHIRRTQQDLWSTFESNRPDIEAHDNSTTYYELQHAASLLFARPLLPIPSPLQGQQQQQQQQQEEENLLLVPLLTNARHKADCPHYYFTDTCPSSSSSSSELCVFWVAGSDLPAGSEVCVSFGHLRSDQALLMYGLPLEAADSSSSSSSSSTEVWLSGMDHISSTDEEPLAPIETEPLTHWIAGSRDEALSEAVFLLELHQNRTQNTTQIDNITALEPVPWDPSGAFLSQLRQWRQQRLAAIESELSWLLTEWDISREEVQELLLQQQEQQGGGGSGGVFGAGGTGQGLIDGRFSSNSSDPWQRMLDWMKHNGAVINVNVTHAGPQFGRVVVTTAPAKRGELLAAIPMDLVWNVVTSGGNGTMQLAAANFYAEIDDPTSPLRPYLDALPSQEELLCPLVHLPPEYLPLLASEKAESFVEAYQAQISAFWEDHGDDMAAKVPSVTLERFKHARALLATRLFGLSAGASMIPLLDLANHAPDCPNIHEEAPCPNEPERSCIVWSAGAFLPPGAEVCNGYKWMSNDRSMLQYGFLQAGPIADALHSVDHAATNSSNIFQVFDALKHGPQPFNGTVPEIKAEIARLTAALANVTATDNAAAAAAPVPTDRDGRLLSLLREWRQQRKAAIQKELGRLEQLLQTQAVGGNKEEAEASVDARLVQWIQDRGGQVNGLTVGASAADSSGSSSGSSGDRPGVIASKAIKAGQILAVVPLELALPVNTDNLLLDGPVLHSELRDTRSSRAPFYATLAAHASSGFSFYDIPVEYGPVIQHKPTEDVLARSNSTLIDFLEDNPDLLSGHNMTLADLKHTFTLLATRLVLFKPEGGHLVPLLDLANHQNGCQHSLTVEACDKIKGFSSSSSSSSSNSSSSSSSSSSSGSVLNTTRLCVVWKAGADVAPGQDVCKSVGWLLPDRALLQYGFLPQELQQQQQKQQQLQQQQWVPLFGMDRHDFKQQARGQLPWRYRLDSSTEPEPFVAPGDSKDLHFEIIRLELLTDSLAAGDAAADAVTPTPDDTDGRILSQLRHLRQLRKTAVAQEVSRLRALQHAEAAAQQKDEL